MMLSASNFSWNLADIESDYWAYNDFEVFYDGRIRLTVNYNLSGAVIDCVRAAAELSLKLKGSRHDRVSASFYSK